MGSSKSKPLRFVQPTDQTTVDGAEDQPRCGYLFRRKKIRIDNNTSTNARIVITPGPITNLKSLQIEKIGSVEVENIGTYHPQKFHILDGHSKKLRVKAREFYVTCLLEIHNGDKKLWGFLWENRLFSCFEDICIIERHIKEALLDAQTQVNKELEEKRKECPVLHIPDVNVYERYEELTPEQREMWKFSAVGRMRGGPLNDLKDIDLHDFTPGPRWRGI